MYYYIKGIVLCTVSKRKSLEQSSNSINIYGYRGLTVTMSISLPEVIADFGLVFVDNDASRSETQEVFRVSLTLKNTYIKLSVQK